MGEVIHLNTRGYAHVICSSCRGSAFAIEVTEGPDPQFYAIICEGCGNVIPVTMTPCFEPAKKS